MTKHQLMRMCHMTFRDYELYDVMMKFIELAHETGEKNERERCAKFIQSRLRKHNMGKYLAYEIRKGKIESSED